jgi:hypothetical protein
MKKILLMMLAFVSITTFAKNGEQQDLVVPVELQVGTIDPTVDHGGPHKNPIQPPLIYREDGILTFVTPCDGCELRLLNDEDEVEFHTIISGFTLELPCTLSGCFQLQIISGNYIFFGDIIL